MFGFVKEEPEEGIKAQVLSSFLASSLNIELVYIILAGITRFSSNESMQQKQRQMSDGNGSSRRGSARDGACSDERGEAEYLMQDQKFLDRQQENLRKIDPFEHIRNMQLNKIRINNSTKWDIAKYDEYVMKDGKDYYDDDASSNQPFFGRRTQRKRKTQGPDGDLGAQE